MDVLWDTVRNRTIPAPAGKPPSDAATRRIARDYPRACGETGKPWRTAMFRLFLGGASDGDWPVATLGSKVRDAIGAKSRTVRLSAATAAKQARHHSELGSADYARVQRILDEGEVFDLGRGQLSGFLEIDGQLWRVVVKRTGDRSETYLSTLHMARPRDVAAVRRRSKRVDLEGS